MDENASRATASSPWTIVVVFVVVDALKHALVARRDLEPLLALQRAIARASRSLARRARDDATYEREVEKLRTRLAALERRRTPRTRAALRCAHWAHVGKAVCGLAFALANARVAMFALPSACAWPMGAWLSFGLGEDAREGMSQRVGGDRVDDGERGGRRRGVSRVLDAGGARDAAPRRRGVTTIDPSDAPRARVERCRARFEDATRRDASGTRRLETREAAASDDRRGCRAARRRGARR